MALINVIHENLHECRLTAAAITTVTSSSANLVSSHNSSDQDRTKLLTSPPSKSSKKTSKKRKSIDLNDPTIPVCSLVHDLPLDGKPYSDRGIWLRKFESLLSSPTGYKSIFQHLLNDMEMDVFQRDYWEKRPIVFRRDADNTSVQRERPLDSSFLKIFSRQQLVDILKGNKMTFETNMSMMKYVDDEKIPYEIPRKSLKKFGEHIFYKDVEKAMKKGNTVQFFQPQRYSDNLYTISSGFEYVFGTLAGASAYLTPIDAQGLAPHYDDIEAFIIQTEGTKKWRLYKNTVSLPETHSQDIKRDDLPKDCAEFTLYPGDMLYFPRGTIHEALSQDSFSTHVTISLYQKNNVKALLERTLPNTMARMFDTVAALRDGLPIRMNRFLGSAVPHLDSKQNASRDEYHAKMKALLHAMVDEMSLEDIDDAADKFSMDFNRNRLPPPDIAADYENYNSSSTIFYEQKKVKYPILEPSKVFHDEALVQICDPGAYHVNIVPIKEETVFQLSNSRFRERMKHMGHPVDDEEEVTPKDNPLDVDEDESSDDEDIDEDGDGDDDDDMDSYDELSFSYDGTEGDACFPVRLLPILQALEAAYPSGGIIVRDLVKKMEIHGILQDEVKKYPERLFHMLIPFI